VGKSIVRWERVWSDVEECCKMWKSMVCCGRIWYGVEEYSMMRKSIKGMENILSLGEVTMLWEVYCTVKGGKVRRIKERKDKESYHTIQAFKSVSE